MSRKPTSLLKAIRGGPAPPRILLLVGRVWDGSIDPGQVFDLTLPLNQIAGAHRAVDERRAVKARLRP